MGNFMDLKSLGYSAPRRMGTPKYADLAGLLGYDAFSAAAGFILVGDIAFSDVWSWNDWKGGDWLTSMKYWNVPGASNYQPLTAAQLNAINDKWFLFKSEADSGMNPAASTLMDQFSTKLRGLAAQSDALIRQQDGPGHWNDETNAERARVFTSINTTLKQVLATNIPAPPPQPVVTNTPPIVATTTGASTSAANTPRVDSTYSTYASTSAGLTSTSGKIFGLPIAVVIPAGLAAVVAALMVMRRVAKRKKAKAAAAAAAAAPKLAGYSRKRRLKKRRR